ncbi:MAG: alpha/beta hydrolase [Acidobacteriota bacterium]
MPVSRQNSASQGPESVRVNRRGPAFVMILLAASLLGAGVSASSAANAQPPKVKPPATGSVLLSPIEITAEGLDFVGHEGLLFVPENRAAETSRQIAVHFFRFPAKQKPELAPVFILPGGPGGSISERSFYEYYRGPRAKAFTTELEILNQRRDLVIVNQRGNARAPGMQPDTRWQWEAQGLDETLSEAELRQEIRQTVERNVKRWQELGIDLAGYDILNIVDDLEDLRQALGYRKIALRGTSFGSQWSLSYMRRYPQRVDRALLSGIEPLDHAYDSPQGLWNALQRLERRALADAELVASLPPDLAERGLLASFLQKVAELAETPATVGIGDPDDGGNVDVLLGSADLKGAITGALPGSLRDRLAAWPSFVAEVVAGDLRMVAADVAETRQDTITGPMIGLLIDSSLGISSRREAKLKEEAAFETLGDINLWYTATREVTPTPVVDDTFRRFESTAIPVLMIQGDMDFSTPIENALELLPYLENGHLVTVRDGTHGALVEMIQLRPEIARQVLAFINEDFDVRAPAKFFDGLPKEIELPPLAFRKHGERPLYEDDRD